ncbi:FUSC family protein [Streptomyces sp. NPDC002004]
MRLSTKPETPVGVPTRSRATATRLIQALDEPGTLRWLIAVRATFAAALAWEMCRTFLGQPQPYPAALAALLVTHPTVARSCTAALQYLSGCAIGALIALPVALLTGPTVWGLSVVLLLSLLAAGSGRLGPHGIHVPITALFVLMLGRGQLVAGTAPHLAEIAVGVAVGAAFHALFLPPLRLRPAEAALDRLRQEVAGVLRGSAKALAEARDPDDVLGGRWRQSLTSSVREARQALDQAHESLRWNLRARTRSVWHLDQDVLDTLERLADDAGAIVRTLDRPPVPASAPAGRLALDRPFRARYARLLNSTALCVHGCRGGRPHPVLPATRRAWDQLVRTSARPPHSVDTRATEGRLLVILDRALDDLGDGRPQATWPPRETERPVLP